MARTSSPEQDPGARLSTDLCKISQYQAKALIASPVLEKILKAPYQLTVMIFAVECPNSNFTFTYSLQSLNAHLA